MSTNIGSKNRSTDGCGVGAGGVNHPFGRIPAQVGRYALNRAVLLQYFRNGLFKMELRAQLYGPAEESVHAQQRGSGTVPGRPGAAAQILFGYAGRQLTDLLRAGPVYVQPEAALHFQQLLQHGLVVLGINGEKVASLYPAYIVTVFFFPGGENFNASKAGLYFRAVGMRGAHAAYRTFVLALAGRSRGFQHQRPHIPSRQRQRQRRPDAPRADDYNVICFRHNFSYFRGLEDWKTRGLAIRFGRPYN